jgi:hypothetical protein
VTRDPRKGPSQDHRGLTNGFGPRDGAAPANGTGRTNGRTNGLAGGAGRTNGLTMGHTGRTNGLASGRGRTNGLTNGTGRTNGTGVINGLINGSYRQGLRANRYGVITQRDLRLGVSVVFFFLLLLGPFYLIMSTTPTSPPSGIVVDGNLADWSGTTFLEDTVTSPNDDIEITGYSAVRENGYLSFAIRVAGIALGDPTGFDGFYVFIDADASPATGYSIRSLGADSLVAVRGGDNAVSTASLLEFRGAGSSDWAGWEPTGTVRAVASGEGLEVQLQPDDVAADFGEATEPAFLIGASDYEGNEVLGSVHFDLTLRALLIRQDSATPIVPATGQPEPFASLTFTAFGGMVGVTGVPLTKIRGPGLLEVLGPFAVPVGSPLPREVAVAFNPGDVGEYVVAHVDPARVGVSGGFPVTVDGPDVVAYLGSAYPGHRVDGYFGEWTQLGSDIEPVSAANVDIENFAANRTGSTAFVYADVAGRIFGGSGIVERFDPPTGGDGGQGSPGTPTVRKGEDVFSAFIDVDTTGPGGVMALGVRADFRIEIRGVHGQVVSSQGYQWTGSWTPFSGAVSVENDRGRMEASLDLGGITTGPMRMAVQMTNWELLSDASGVFNFLDAAGDDGTRGAPILGPLDGTGAEDAEATTLANGDATVDGNCATTATEYDGAGLFDDPGIAGRVGTSGSYVFICIDVTADTDDEAATDQGTIYFDTLHDGGTAPQTDDRRFSVLSGSSALLSDMGDGATWVACISPDCDTGNLAAGAFTGGHEVYEFKIRFANVWGDDAPAPDQVAGFAVRAIDFGGAVTTWGSTDPPSDTDPGTWGHVVAPEFHDVIVPVAVVGVIYLIARRRRRDADP